MNNKKTRARYSGLLAVMLTMMSLSVGAAEADDPQQRIRELERQMQQMAEQLKAVQEQLARTSANSTEPASAQPAAATTISAGGRPVEATFKNGLVLRDSSGDWAMRVYARAQLDYRNFSPDPSAADTFSMRRGRVGVIATFYDDFTLRIEGEYSGDGIASSKNTYMNDGYLDYTHFKQAMVRVGQFKGMHGLERSQGAMDLNFMERAMTESLLGSVFDRGVMLHGAPLDGVYYNLAYVNGTGQNLDETDALTDSKDWSLRVVGNAAQWAGLKNSVVHLGGFYLDGEQDGKPANGGGVTIPKVRTEGRGAEFFSATSPTQDVDRTLYGLESAVAYGPVKYQGEYIRASYDGHGYDHDMSAWYASLQWLVTGEHYADRYASGAFLGILPKRNFQHGKPGWGALELGMRYSQFDASDFLLADSATRTYTDGADAWTLGAKWVFNPSAQVQLNYVYTDYDDEILINGSREDHERAMNMRVQFDF